MHGKNIPITELNEQKKTWKHQDGSYDKMFGSFYFHCTPLEKDIVTFLKYLLKLERNKAWCQSDSWNWESK